MWARKWKAVNLVKHLFLIVRGFSTTKETITRKYACFSHYFLERVVILSIGSYIIPKLFHNLSNILESVQVIQMGRQLVCEPNEEIRKALLFPAEREQLSQKSFPLQSGILSANRRLCTFCCFLCILWMCLQPAALK